MELPEQKEGNRKINWFFATVIELEGKLYSNQPGYFLQVSHKGNRYVIIFYTYDANDVKGIPIKNQTASEFLRAYKEMYDELTSKHYAPKLHKLNNESSQEVIYWIEEQKTNVQFTPPDMHRQYLNKHAIQTWKSHFIAGLASLPDDFPIAYWCSLDPHTNITLNMMHPCCQNPALSAYAALEGCFNFDTTPMAPPGTTAFNCKTSGFHTMETWYVGPALRHYRCYTVIMNDMAAKHISDTVQF
eukprot:1514839-Ditylum_brightwellii.AAC.1